MKTFRPYEPDQMLLMPPSLGDWVPEDHLARFVSDLVLKEVKTVLHPEFINRVDEIIVFDALSDEDLLAIARLMISQLNSSLADRGIRLTLTDEAYRWLIDKTCSDRSYGARPLRRAIQKNIEDALSESLILGKFPENGEIEIFVDQERLAFREPIEIAR